MDNAIKVILKKLDDIENRIKALETREKQQNISKIERDPLFSEAIKIIDKYEEVSAHQLAKELKIEISRAELIMDQLEEAGLGACYFKEI